MIDMSVIRVCFDRVPEVRWHQAVLTTMAGIYHMMIHLKDIPFLEDIPGSQMDNVFVRDLMTTPVVTLRHHESVTNARRILMGCKHNGYLSRSLRPDAHPSCIHIYIYTQYVQF